MLLVLMYHQIVNPKSSHGLEEFKQHLQYLQDHYPIILPGGAIQKNTINLCLTFDDAYFDFYYHMFPILQKQSIPAIVGVPTNLIQENTTAKNKDRLAIPYPLGLEQTNKEYTTLCTWQEPLKK